jgi:hypothetical protein
MKLILNILLISLCFESIAQDEQELAKKAQNPVGDQQLNRNPFQQDPPAVIGAE